MKECIYRKSWGGVWWLRLLMCFGNHHIWDNTEKIRQGIMTIEKNKCIDCGREEILILIQWGYPKFENSGA